MSVSRALSVPPTTVVSAGRRSTETTRPRPVAFAHPSNVIVVKSNCSLFSPLVACSCSTARYFKAARASHRFASHFGKEEEGKGGGGDGGRQSNEEGAEQRPKSEQRRSFVDKRRERGQISQRQADQQRALCQPIMRTKDPPANAPKTGSTSTSQITLFQSDHRVLFCVFGATNRRQQEIIAQRSITVSGQ
uniref:Uncharacterized protein n=1 Tax=Plectus sambesii TaxID=2011161 RepID=A0A914WV61_9BILA